MIRRNSDYFPKYFKLNNQLQLVDLTLGMNHEFVINYKNSSQLLMGRNYFRFFPLFCLPCQLQQVRKRNFLVCSGDVIYTH